MNILFASSEVYPLIKTGGLADVSSSLPTAFAAEGHDVRIVMPAYADALTTIGKTESIARFTTFLGEIEVLKGKLIDTGVTVLLLNAPEYFAHPGNPYLDENGIPWSDSAERFCQFCYSIVEIAQNRAGISWQPDILHCNDWQTGLAPALLNAEATRPVSIFTIHNLAYQGVFPHAKFAALGLPDSLWSIDALEFHGQISFIKGGLIFADHITTVSPTYSQEILTSEFGCGLEGLLGTRKSVLHGILNGIDQKEWNPESDANLASTYNEKSLERKLENKRAIQDEFALQQADEKPLIGMIGRLVEQKGLDLVIDSIEALLKLDIQLVLLGTGTAAYEQQLLTLSERYPEQIGVRIGFSERLAHRIEAGADMFLMPSRFEPCGLNQLYSLRYGTIPIVRQTGGLADTVIDATPENILTDTATGVVFSQAEPHALVKALDWAVVLYRQQAVWRRLQITAMSQDFSWQRSASHYLSLFKSALSE